ncbi:DUF4902 domain-containing protein [Paucibacter sp. APW11]|uniref:DUF4902 domain-containing protein n=1 Tax=Roseateles aquae TaxID=3077235 RepID=A0ABU3PBG4_9BURK|nr:DUF4902 domain-containing protein [Paucibacter sp. APW11]MDT8999868.1 DUF4902 domain-containing protein [Paucibacter sp. APW11]
MFDAYVRLSIDDLQKLVPTHLHSEIEDLVDDADPDASIQGFTEWTAASTRTLSFGWDWCFEPSSEQLLGQWGSLRTNLMVIDESGGDMGIECTRLCIARLMTHIRWEYTIAKVLGLRLQLQH